MTPAGTCHGIYPGLGGSQPRYIITKGSDGTMWFTNFGGGAIGRITTPFTPAITGFTPDWGTPSDQVTITGHALFGSHRGGHQRHRRHRHLFQCRPDA